MTNGHREFYQSIRQSAVVGYSPWVAPVADEMERWIAEGDIDGFNIGHVVVPGTWEDVVKYFSPELERRAWLGNGDYAVPGGTARENLYNTPGNAKLRENHPEFKYKWTDKPSE